MLVATTCTWAHDSRGDDRSSIRVPLAPVQTGSKARGDLFFEIRPETKVRGVTIPAHAELMLRVRKLAGNTTYRLRANGVDRTTFTTNKRGKAKVVFGVLAGDGTQPILEFDPRGMLISVAEMSGTEVLGAVLYGPLEPPTTKFQEQVDLTPGSGAAGATAKARYRSRKKGSRALDVEVKDLPEGDYSVRIDGTPQGTLSVTRKRKHTAGKLSLDTRATKKKPATLGMDPRGLPLELVGSSGTAFSGVMKAALPGGDSSPGAVSTVSLTLQIPDFASSAVEGINIFRRDDVAGTYVPVERIVLWPPRQVGSGEVIDYSFVDLNNNSVNRGKFEAPVQRGQSGNAVTFALDFGRPAPAAFFKISTFNSAGESPRSSNAVQR